MEAVGAGDALPVLLEREHQREAAAPVPERVGARRLLPIERAEQQREAAADPAALQLLGLKQAAGGLLDLLLSQVRGRHAHPAGGGAAGARHEEGDLRRAVVRVELEADLGLGLGLG